MTEPNNLISALVLRSRQSSHFKKIYSKLILNTSKILNFKNTDLSAEEIDDLLIFADIFSNSENADDRNLSYRIISLIYDIDSDDEKTHIYSNAVLSKLGNFPTLSAIGETRLPFERALEREIKREMRRIPFSKEKFFTDSQLEIFERIKDANCFSFSGPTSMGKSYIFKTLIKHIVSESTSKTTVVLVPTRALITQVTIELKKDFSDSEIDKSRYKISTNSRMAIRADSTENNILVLTPERLLSYLGNEEKYPIDYLFFDEAHKLAADRDTRSIPFYLAIQSSLQTYPDLKLFFASPNVDNPELFLEVFKKNSRNKYQTKESPVTQNLFFIDKIEKNIQILDPVIGIIPLPQDPRNPLFEESTIHTIHSIAKENSSIIYCSSIVKTIEHARELAGILNSSQFSDEKIRKLRKLINHVKSEIHEEYFLIDCLEKGVAFHFGNLPQPIREKVEELFEEEVITYLFCTSTLLEGVNLPAKNVFILDNKKGPSAMEPIDFWNLAGRAGRLTIELFGNIICIRESASDWKKKEILEKKEIHLQITALTRLDRNLKKIEKLLENKSISGTETEQEILHYIANIIQIDTLEIESNYKSPIISRLIEMNKEKIIELAKKRNDGLTIPLQNLKIDKLTSIIQQNKVYKYLKENVYDLDSIKLPGSVDYENCKEALLKLYELYDWQNKEYSKLTNKNSLVYYAFLMNVWINGIHLKQIIEESIRYKDENKEKILIYRKKKRELEIFNKHDKHHINVVINDLIKDIEQILRFRLEKYFNNYHTHLKSVVGEEKAGANWANYLEYGTRDNKIISLQNQGVSRQTATLIIRKYPQVFEEKNGEIFVNKELLLKLLPPDSIERDEVTKLL